MLAAADYYSCCFGSYYCSNYSHVFIHIINVYRGTMLNAVHSQCPESSVGVINLNY